MTRLRCNLGMGYWMWRAGATRSPVAPYSCFYHVCFHQWNMRGLQAKREELSLLLSQYDSTAVCIQETLFHSNKTASFKKYTYYGIPAVENNSSLHGGVAVLIKNSTPHQQLHVNTGLQTIALRATCHKTITICSIYIFPSIACNITELEDLIRQLPLPVLLLGDFKAHSQPWGSTKRSTRGKMVEDFLLKSNLSLLNCGSPTYLHPATASFSAIDLSVTHPALYLEFCWQTDSDLHGSDHYLIVITTDTPSPSFSKHTWKLHKADWAAFSHQAALELCTDTICSAEDHIQQFTDVVINIADNSIPNSKPNTKKT